VNDPERPIAIPWKVRLQYVCTHWLQPVLFLISVVALGWLWTYRAPQTVVVGQVEAIEVSVPASAGATLMPLQRQLAPFDRVQQGVTLVARLDVSDLLMEMQTLTAERDRIKSTIDSETERLRLQQQQWDFEQGQQQRDLMQQSLSHQRNLTSADERIDDLRRELNEIRDRRRKLALKQSETAAASKVLAMESSHLSGQRRRLSELIERSMASTTQLAELDQQIELKQCELAESEAIGKTIAEQVAELDREITVETHRLAESTNSRDELTATEAEHPKEAAPILADAETLLAPLEHALRVQDAKIRQLAQQISANEILAPVSGMVSKIHFPPGTYVPRGEPIITIAAESARCIVAYVDPAFGKGLRKNGTVQIRVRASGSIIAEAKVMELGSQNELMPKSLRRNPNFAQYGLPVKVSIPHELPLIPGELVDLVFTDHSALASSL
jgi:hypothetical protein